MSPDRWKRHGREIARLLGGRRLSDNGAALASRDAAATAPGSVPVVIAHPTPPVGSRRCAVLELGQPAALLALEAVAGTVAAGPGTDPGTVAADPGIDPGIDPIAAKEIRTGKIGQEQAAFANDFGLIHAHAREIADRSRMDGIAKRPESDGAGPQVVENPCENARKVPRNPAGARRNAPQRSDSA